MDLRTKESCSQRSPRVTLGINSRILGIELRYRRFGYAALEIPRQLLETGVRTFRSATQVAEVLRPLVKLFAPSVIVIKIAAHHDKRYHRGMAASVRCLRKEASAQSIPVDRITAECVRSALGGSAMNKEQIARMLIRTFPALGWKLPPTREGKPWVSEGWNMAIFDAVAIGLAYLEKAPVDVPGC